MAEIVASLTNHRKSILVLDAARRRARELGCPWHVILVLDLRPTNAEGSSDKLKAAERLSVQALLKLGEKARALGATVNHLETSNPDVDLLFFLEAMHDKSPLTHIFLGESAPTRRWFFHRSINEKILLALGSAVSVTVIPLERTRRGAANWPTRINGAGSDGSPLSYRAVLFSLAALLVALAASLAVGWLTGLPPGGGLAHSASLLFLLASLFISFRHGVRLALPSAFVSVLAINYFFVAPAHTFQIGARLDFINLVVFVSSAVLVAFLASQVRTVVATSKETIGSQQAISAVFRLTNAASTYDEVIEILDQQIDRYFDFDVGFFLPDAQSPGNLSAAPANALIGDLRFYPGDIELTQHDRSALDACWRQDRPTGLGTKICPDCGWRFDIISSDDETYGVLGVRPLTGDQSIMKYIDLIGLITDQLAATLERVDLMASLRAVEVRENREQLRSLLLSSISHDLKTPLASIIGGLGVVQSLNGQGKLSAEKESELIENALSEANRLDGFINNILSMTKLENEAIDFKKTPSDPADPVRTALKVLALKIGKRPIEARYHTKNRLINMDVMLVQQVLLNILDNALKYTPPEMPIEIDVDDSFGSVIKYRVRDFGPGIPPGKLEAIFDKYERAKATDSKVAGTGLGLAISKATITAMGGDIVAENHAGGGAQFTISLPIDEGGNEGGDQADKQA